MTRDHHIMLRMTSLMATMHLWELCLEMRGRQFGMRAMQFVVVGGVRSGGRITMKTWFFP